MITGIATLTKVFPIVELPYTQYIPNSNDVSNIGVIFGHGLGAKNPKLKSYINDEWAQFFITVTSNGNLPVTLYTARGHGDSHGWEHSSTENYQQFTWNSLSFDMNEVAHFVNYEKYIACGSSMGSATSFFASINFPDNVIGVIMIRPPTAWQSRLDRRKYLLGSASKLKEKEEETNEHYHNVLLGTAYSDFPEIDDDVYNRIRTPFLILSIENDESHPVSTAKSLHGLITSSHLHIAKDEDEAKQKWPELIKQFIELITKENTHDSNITKNK